ncbi:RNA-binding protein 33-like isoform X4 [Dermacentor albipictus]|uniref:RNA-binding protein 33-like isoform X4 n=1 Tax=Dermacentor albipictus TaxID=60249 RepID=UPI0038FC40E4
MARIAEDDILDDDIQGKDDYELDLADEDALLGLDEDEARSSGGSRDHAAENVSNIQYVDEEGNPVAVRDGDSLEIVEEYSYSEERTNDDGDVLDVDIDPDFDSLIQDNEDLESLSSLQPRSQRLRPPNRPQKPAQNAAPAPNEKPEEPIPSLVSEPPSSPSLSRAASDERRLEDEEEEEEEGGRRGRFQTERRAGTVIATVSSKRRQAIPDSLDAVISQEDAAKIDAYLSREDDRRQPNRRGRGRGGNFRGHNNKRGGNGAPRGGGTPRGGYRGAAQHIEPWVAPPFAMHGPGLVRFGAQSPPQRAFRQGNVASAEGPRGKIFVNPQFRNGAAGLGPGVQNEGAHLGIQPFQNARGPPLFGNQQPEPFLRPPFVSQGGPPLVLRTEPFVSANLLHPSQQPPPPHVARPNLPPQHFPPAPDHFIIAGQLGGFEVSAQGPRSSEFGGPQPPVGSDAFRQSQPLDLWRTPPAGRAPPDTVQQNRLPMRPQQQPHQPQHQQQQQQHHQQQQPHPHSQYGNMFPPGAPMHHQHQQQQQQQQHHQQQQHSQQPQHNQQLQHHQQPQQQPSSPLGSGGHQFQTGPAYQGASLSRVAGGPPHMAHHPQGPNILEQQQQRQFHPPPPPQNSAAGGSFPPMQGVAQPRYAGPVQASTGFGGPPRFQQPPPREPFGKRPCPTPPAAVPPKAARLEAPRMPRKPNQGPPARTVNNANIKEVPILDYLPPPEPEKATLPPAIEEDAATQELRRKIEEQKKLREQVMRIKEERRKLAAMQRQKNLLEQQLQSTAQPPAASTAPSTAAGTSTEKPQAATASAGGSVKQRLGVRPATPAPAQQAESAPVLKKVVIVRRAGQQQQQPQVPGATMAPRAPGPVNQINAEAPGTVVMHPPAARLPHAVAVGRVLVSNLSASTNENSLRHLGRSCGVVTEIILDKNQRQAVVKFREHQQAVQFQKKYQRHMLDLSMIQVSLLPP